MGDGFEDGWSVEKAVPGGAASVDAGVVGVEDAQGEVVFPQVLPDVLDGIELQRIGRQASEGDVAGQPEGRAGVPSCAIEDEDGVGARSDGAADLAQMEVHGLAVSVGQDESGADGTLVADSTEQVGPFISAVARGPGPGADTSPNSGERALLSDAGLVLEPDLDRLVVGVVGQRLGYQGGEVFLKASCAASS